jgi:transposase
MAMLHAIAEGETSADALAHLARSRLRQKLADLKLALDVTVQPHHRLLLRSQLQRLARTDADIEALGATIAQHTEPYAEHIALLKTIPGIDDVAAVEIFAEVGADLSSFEHDGRFAAWTGLCPGNNISAGKRLPGKRRRRGNPYLQSIVVEASLAATRRKATYLRDKYFRLKARRGPMRALLAIAHKLARAVYRVLTTREPYKDLGPGYLDRRDPHRVSRQLITRLHELGHTLESVTQLFCAVQSRAAAHAAPAPT